MILPNALPVLPLRDMVVFPGTVAPLLVGQERSLVLVREVMNGDHLVALVTQRDPEARPARPEHLYAVGTMARIHETMRAQGETLRIAIQAIDRVRITSFLRTEPYLVASVELWPEVEEVGIEVTALARAARQRFIRLVTLAGELSDDLTTAVDAVDDPRAIASLIASSTPLPAALRQELLEMPTPSMRLRRLIEVMQHEIAVRELVQKITVETNAEMSRAQRDHVLRKHMEAIQRELGECAPELSEQRELHDQIDRTALSDEARREAVRELARLERTPSISPEHGMIQTYLDWMVRLPWGKFAGETIDLERARAILDEDHYDLQKIKERLLEHLAVRRLRSQRGAERPRPESAQKPGRGEPILCFVGPPGVGKTSLGQSIARAMGRTFARISLGGIHDEAEIRGHRRTYIGAMPGRILQAIARAKTADPVFMLDEVDKLGAGFHGDPAAALLEVLDPAQNHAFADNYLGVPFDLSRVLFIGTANTADAIPPPLLDRMEVLRLDGYTETEKLHIARKHLLPLELGTNGLAEGEVFFEDDALRRIVRDYTREAGVRNLERDIGTILRRAARRVSDGERPPITIHEADIRNHLGPPRFFDEIAERTDRPGVATGLGWTPSGGEILFVEASMMPSDEERLLLTGMLGNVMRESAEAALSYLRSNAPNLGIDGHLFAGKLVHVHVPAGSIPKDGPSAGVAILTALASMASGRPVRHDLAMTGEISLRGKVLPVGGVKEKILAAHRAGIQAIVLPERNLTALEDVPADVLRAVEVFPVEAVEEVLSLALTPAVQSAEPEPPGLH